MIVKLLTEHYLEFLSFKGGCRGSSEYTHVKMPHCWKSHALAHIINFNAIVSSGARALHLTLSLHLHPYFVKASSKNALASQRMCADSPEHSLLADAIRTDISCTGPYVISLGIDT